MGAVEIVLDLIMVGVCIGCAVTDLRRHEIYDWITLPALGIGLGVRFIVYGLGGMFDDGLASSLLGAGFCFLVFGLFMIWGKGMGGGDVKLISAVGALAGFRHALTCAMCSTIVGGVMAVVLLIARRKLLGAARGFLKDLFTTRVDDADRITLPYGLPIALGVIWAGLMKYGVLGGI